MFEPERESRGSGRVQLVGAGPGAPDLLTVRALRALAAAEVVIYDALLPEDFLARAGINTAGKRLDWLGADRPHRAQAEINRAMSDWARRGRRVVRLKNGDPFIFGRGQEEIDFLNQAGIAWEVVPGASAFSAALAEAGLALTQRGAGRSFAAVSARCAGGGLNLRLPRADSLVVYMGAGVLPELVQALLCDGWPENTPAALVENGTLPGARCLLATLQELPERARIEAIGSPCLVVVGAAARRRFLPAGAPEAGPAWEPALPASALPG